MTEAKFISKNENTWHQLEAFNATFQKKGIKALSREEIREFAACIRTVSYHLAYAKTHFSGGTSLPYLTGIVGVAHNFYYVREKSGPGAVWQYFRRGFPEAVRRNFRYSLAAAIIFLAGTLFAYAYVAVNPQNFSQIFPFPITLDELNFEGEVVWDYAVMSAFIMTNNISVSIRAFAFGISAGVGTVWILFYNGIILGALAALVDSTGYVNNTIIFWSLILPHGVPELIAIYISGACGLMLGKGIIAPGRYRRRDAVIIQAKEAVTLIPGIVTLLVLAGLIEGFFTPLGISPYFKLGFSAVTLAVLMVYFARAR